MRGSETRHVLSRSGKLLLVKLQIAVVQVGEVLAELVLLFDFVLC